MQSFLNRINETGEEKNVINEKLQKNNLNVQKDKIEEVKRKKHD
jgi:hypothetical protein